MSSVKRQAAILKLKFGVNQHDKVLREQQSLGLRRKKLFPNEDIKEEYSVSDYRTDFAFKNHMLVVEIDEKGHVDRDPDFKRKRQKQLENCGYYFIRIDPDKKDFNDYEEFGRVNAYITKSNRKSTEKLTKKLWLMIFQKDC